MINIKISKKWTSFLVAFMILALSFTTPVFALDGYSAIYTSNSSVISMPSDCVDGQLSVEIKGRTVDNVASFGDCEATTGWSTSTTSVAIDSDNELFGTNCLKVTISADGGYINRDILSLLDTSKYYLISGYIKNGNLSGSGIRMNVNCLGDTGISYGAYVTATSYNRTGHVIQPSDFDTASDVHVVIQGSGLNTEYGFVDGIMINEITSSEYAEGADALLDRYNWHLGTKSTLNHRFKSVGKNLANPEKMLYQKTVNTSGYIIDATTTLLVDVDVEKSKQYSPIIPSGFMLSAVNHFNDDAYITVDASYVALGNRMLIKYRKIDATDITISEFEQFKNEYQLERGSSATAYEEYKESLAYVVLPDGKELRSVPNGTQDEVTADGKYIQKISDDYVLQSADITALNTTLVNVDLVSINRANLTGIYAQTAGVTPASHIIPNYTPCPYTTSGEVDNIANDGQYLDTATWSANIQLIVAKGTYIDLAAAQADLAGTVLNYQLATPTTQDLLLTPLTCYRNGTLIIDKAVSDSTVYTSNITIENPSLPIKELEEVYKIENAVLTPIDLSLVTVASDGLSFTINGALDGQTYQYVYKYPDELGTLPTIEYSVPINTTGQINGNTEMINQHTDIINYILQQIQLLRDEIDSLGN